MVRAFPRNLMQGNKYRERIMLHFEKKHWIHILIEISIITFHKRKKFMGRKSFQFRTIEIHEEFIMAPVADPGFPLGGCTNVRYTYV